MFSFNLLERAHVLNSTQDKKSLSFYTSVGSFLDTAIRANQSDSVRFFLSEGADPTMNRPNILLRNSILTAILIGDLFLPDSQNRREHLRIIDLLMNHPSVNKDFLNQEIIPDLTYPDLTLFKGHLPILNKMYKKGVKVHKKNYLWDTKVLVRDIAFALGFFKTAEFVFQDQVKEGF